MQAAAATVAGIRIGGRVSFLIQVTDTQGNSVNGTVTITINP